MKLGLLVSEDGGPGDGLLQKEWGFMMNNHG